MGKPDGNARQHDDGITLHIALSINYSLHQWAIWRFFCSRFRTDSVVAVFAGVTVGKSQRRLYYLGRDQRRIQGYLLPLSYCYLPFFSVCHLFMCHLPCLFSPLYVLFSLSVFTSLCVICLVCLHLFMCHLPCLFSLLYVLFALSVFTSLRVICLVCFHLFTCDLPFRMSHPS